MAISKITGPLLSSNLNRLGDNLSVESGLLYFDVNTRRIGVNNFSPTEDLDVNGTIKTINLNANDIFGNFGSINTINSDELTSLRSNLGQIKIENSEIFTSPGIDIVMSPGSGIIFTNALVKNLELPIDPQDATSKIYVDSKFGDLVITGSTITSGGNTLVLDTAVDINGPLTVDLLSVGYGLEGMSGKFGNIQIQGNDITSTDVNGNINIDPNGSGAVIVVGTNGIVLPAGYTADRPLSPLQGTLRYNVETNISEELLI